MQYRKITRNVIQTDGVARNNGEQDMREWETTVKADIMVSELLGSFGDNELSPECLDGAQSFLADGGISIPSDSTSFMTRVKHTVNTLLDLGLAFYCYVLHGVAYIDLVSLMAHHVDFCAGPSRTRYISKRRNKQQATSNTISAFEMCLVPALLVPGPNGPNGPNRNTS